MRSVCVLYPHIEAALFVYNNIYLFQDITNKKRQSSNKTRGRNKITTLLGTGKFLNSRKIIYGQYRDLMNITVDSFAFFFVNHGDI